jgi:RHS repeat-associated protein
MAVTNYDTIDGRIRTESTGGTRTGYLPDALGSVTATVSESGGVVNTYRFKPYGAQLVKTGGGTDPKFLWVGQWGYYQTNVLFADTYIRARHYNRQLGLWVITDPLWPLESAYQYVLGNPIDSIDPEGTQQKGRTRPHPEYVDPGVPVKPRSELCRACAVRIAREWYPTKDHYCNSCYAHCMACCTLAAMGEPECALKIQREQNLYGGWKGDSDTVKNARMKYCQYGVDIWKSVPRESLFREGEVHEKCHSRCSDKCPYKYPNPRPECDKYFKKNPKTGKWEYTLSGKFPYQDVCDPIYLNRTLPPYKFGKPIGSCNTINHVEESL